MRENLKKFVILVSGNGSNLQAVIDAVNTGELLIELTAVISNRKDAFALKRAEKNGIKTVYMPFKKGSDRKVYDLQLGITVEQFAPDYVFLLGWMHLLSSSFLDCFSGKVINLHPALPGTFAGTKAIERQFHAFKNGQIREAGIMTHYVPDEGIDSGPVILTENVPITFSCGLHEFEQRIHEAEHKLVIQTIKKICIS